ncbi:hypothetical protein EDB84DRAFT_1600373 [Lactarius hengduanensis]|nr:hypothetical protein EDB84DRAFT_1600373 [Lactarius hengduanensis]
MSRYYGRGQSFADTSSNITPRHQATREKLLNYVQESARKRMYCEDDVLQYYRKFICLSIPLVHTGHLSEVERDAAFWCGFHPKDRSRLRSPLLAKYPYQLDDDPFPFADVLSCARAAFAYRDPFPSWPQEEPFKPRNVRAEPPVVKHVPRDTYGFRIAPRPIASNAETAPSKLFSPWQLTTDPQLHFPSSLSRSELPDTPETARMPLTPPFSSISPTDSERLQPATDVQPKNELEPTFTSPSSLPHHIPSSYSFAPSATDDNSELTFMPAASLVSSVVLESPPSPMRWTTEDLLKREPVRTPSIIPVSLSLPSTLSLASSSAGNVPEIEPEIVSPDIRLLSPSSPIISESQPAHAHSPTNGQPEAVSASVSSQASLPLISPASPRTPLLPFSFTKGISGLLFVPPAPAPRSVSLAALTPSSPKPSLSTPSSFEIPSPKLASSPNALSPPPDPFLAPLALPLTLETSPSISTPGLLSVSHAPSDLPPATLSPSLVLSDLELKSTPASLLDSDTVSLSFPECLPSSSSGINLPLPAPLKFSPSAPVSPLPLPIDFTILTPPGLLRLSPNVPITPPSLSPLEVTTFSPISPPLEALPDVLFSSPPAPSTQSICRKPIPADSTHSPLQVVFCSPSLSGPDPAYVDFAFPLSIPAISVSDLVKTLSSQTHEFSSKDEDLAGSRSDAAKPRDAFAYQFQREQYTLHPPCFVFDPGGLASALDLTHEYAFERSPRPPSASITESSITAPSRVRQAQRRNSHASSPAVFATPLQTDLCALYVNRLRPASLLRALPFIACRRTLLVPLFVPHLMPSLFPFSRRIAVSPRAVSGPSTALPYIPLSPLLSSPPLHYFPPHLPRLLRPRSNSLARADAHQRKLKTRGSLITTHDTPVPTLVHADILTIFTAETPEKLARRSLTGDGQDFDPPGDVRIARALAPKSYIFGIFDLGPASRGQLPFRIRVLTASRLAIDHHIPLPSFHLPRTHTHTLSLSLLPLARPPLVAVDRRRHPKTLPSPSYAGRAFPRLMSSMSSSLSAAFGHPQDAVGARAPPLDSEEESYCHNAFRFPCIASPIRTVCLSRSSPRSASRLMPPPFPILLLLLPFLPG